LVLVAVLGIVEEASSEPAAVQTCLVDQHPAVQGSFLVPAQAVAALEEASLVQQHQVVEGLFSAAAAAAAAVVERASLEEHPLELA